MSLPWLHTQVADNCSMPTAEEMAAVKVDNARDYYDIVKVKLRKSSLLLSHTHTPLSPLLTPAGCNHHHSTPHSCSP